MTETYQLKHTGEQIDALLDKAGTAVQPTDIPADIATQRELSALAQTTDERLSDLAQTTDAKLTELSEEILSEEEVTDTLNFVSETTMLYQSYTGGETLWVSNDAYYWRLYKVEAGETLILRKLENRNSVIMAAECELDQFRVGGKMGQTIIPINAALGDYQYKNDSNNPTYIAIMYKYFTYIYFDVIRIVKCSISDKVNELEENLESQSNELSKLQEDVSRSLYKEELYGAIFNDSHLIYSDYLNKDNGSTAAASSMVSSDFLLIPSGATSVYYNLAAYDCYICFYDENKNFLKSVLVADSTKLIEGEALTDGASYFRFNCKRDLSKNCYVRFKDVATKEELREVEGRLNNLATEVRDELYVGYYTEQDLIFDQVLAANGTVASARTIKTSDFLPIPNDTKTIKYSLCTNDVLLCYYDVNKNFIGAVASTNTEKLEEGETNPKDYGATYFRFNCKIALMDKCYVKLLKGNSGSSGESESLSATNYGAIGDGISDDTEALEALFNAAYEQQRPIYIPKGTYMIRRSLPIKSNLHIYGDGKQSVIRKFPAVWSQLARVASEGDETIYVESAYGFKVGDQIFISYSENPTIVAARHCSIGVIKSIDTINNAITFVSSYDSIKKGAIRTHAVGCYVCSSFAVLRSWSMFSAAINIKIHDLTLDGNRQEGEPMEWFNAPIHFDPDSGVQHGITYSFPSHNHVIRDCYCINSPYDGISEQGSSMAIVDNVTIENCAMHGVHFGTTFSNGKVINCTMRGNKQQGAAVFFCADAKNIIVQNNYIFDYYRGASDEEYGSAGTDAIFSNNIFVNITDVVFDFPMATEANRGGRLTIANNIVDTLGILFKGDHLDCVIISGNTIAKASNNLAIIEITQSKQVIILGNICQTPIVEFINTTDSEMTIEANNSYIAL